MPPPRSARNLRVAELVANPANIRESVGDITELARAIKQRGVLTPLLVTEDPYQRGWLLLAGHRRLAAAREIGLAAVPCFIHHDVGRDHAEQIVLMLMENVQRKNLSPVEKAKAYGTLRDQGLTPTDIARRTGIHVSSVHTHLALLDLDGESLAAVEDGELTAGEAISAVREHRQATRKSNGQALRGRPVVYEPSHFSDRHPLAALAAVRCDHSTRPKISKGACGQCWEETIREDQEQRTDGNTEPSRAEPSRAEQSRAEPSRAEQSRAEPYDEAAVSRALNGDRHVNLTRTDRMEVVRRARERGWSLNQIQANTQITKADRYLEGVAS